MSKLFTKVIVRTVNDLTNHYWLSEIVIWLWYITFFKCITLYFLLFIIIAWVYFFPAKDVKAGAIEGCQTWMSLTLSDTECMSSLDICQPQTWSHQDSQALCILDSHLPFGTAPPGFQPGLAAWRNSLVYLPLFHSQYASRGHLLEEWF